MATHHHQRRPHRLVWLLLLILLSSFPGLGSFAGSPLEGEVLEAALLPSPPELYLALSREEKVRWRQFYRPPALPTSPDRSRGAFALGGVLADLYIAVEARDKQRVRDVGQDFGSALGVLGLKGRLDHRLRRLGTFAEAEDWAGIRSELDACGNEVASLLAAQMDEDLGVIVDLGLWVRSLEVTLRSCGQREGEKVPEAIEAGVPMIVAALGDRLHALSPAQRNHPLLTALSQELDRAETVPADPALRAKRLAAIIELIEGT